jgi:hypothetical protein
MQPKKESLLSQRGQIAFFCISLWLLLALWSIAAFWEHIDTLKVTYPTITKLGAASGEVALLALVLWHCFNKHMNVRKWSAIFGFLLGAAILVHAGALRGMGEARSVQIDTEKRLEEQLTRMSKDQMQNTRRRVEVAQTAQKELADTVRAGADKVKDTSILPRWYLDGWMYSVLFILSLGCVSIVGSMMRNKEDVDENFDGVADHLQKQDEFPSELPKA